MRVLALWRYLRATYGLRRVYYPGPGGDCCLQAAFPAEDVVYLEIADPQQLSAFYPPAMRRAHVVRGDFTCAPFRDGSFEAAFVQRIGSRLGLLDELYRLVQPGGLVVAHWKFFWPRPTSAAAQERRLRIGHYFTPLPAPAAFASGQAAEALRWAGDWWVLRRRQARRAECDQPVGVLLTPAHDGPPRERAESEGRIFPDGGSRAGSYSMR